MRFIRTLPMIAIFSLATSAFAADEYVMMKVNSQDVSSAEVQRMWEGLFPPGQAPGFDTVKPEMRDRILHAIMAEKLMYGEAVKAGVDKSDKVAKELEDVKRKVIIKNFVESKTAELITDADLKKEYDATVAASKDEKEVRARHILVSTEEEAKAAKKKIDSGKSFEDVAKEISKDPGSAKQGGDLGYFTRDKMVKEFADTAFSMKKGEVSGPVKSGFGYHIIKVEDIRKVSPMPFEAMKDQLRSKLQEKKLNDYVGGLVKSASVKLFDAKGKEVPFDKELTQPGATKADKPAEDKKEKPAAKPEADKADKKQ